MSRRAHALVYSGPGEARIDEVILPEVTKGMVEVETAFSGLSRGTERLVFNGLVPQGEWTRMRAPLQSGDFPFPVRYGYAAVGRAVAGPDALVGRDVFCLHPHQSRFLAPEAMVLPLPADVPPERAVLAANMETALNAVWDAGPGLGKRALVVGTGLLGWLIAALLTRLKDIDTTVTDIRTNSGINAADFGVNFVTPERVPRESFDTVFHTSASAAGLETGLAALAFEGQVIELSWYGDRAISVHLGGAFHANRLRIVCSQVGHIAPQKRPTVSHRGRLARALDHLKDARLDALITEEVAFRDLPDALPRLLGDGAPGIATRIVYD